MKRNGSIVCLSLTSEEGRRRKKSLLFNNIRSSIVSPVIMYIGRYREISMYEKFKKNKYHNSLLIDFHLVLLELSC